MARRRRADRPGRPGVGQRPQVRGPEGQSGPWSSATGAGVAGPHRRRRPGAGSAQRDAPTWPGAVGMAAALAATVAERPATVDRVTALRDRLGDGLLAAVPGTVETGDRDRRVAGILHVRFAGVEAEAAVVLLDEAGRGRLGRGRLLERGRRAQPRAGRHGTRPGRGLVGRPLLVGCHHHRRGCGPCPGSGSRRRRPPAKLGRCASWWPCPVASTRRWPPRCWPRPTGPTTWSVPPSSCGAATPTRAAARWPTWTTPGGWPTSWASSTTCSTSAAEFEAHVVDPYVAGHAEGRPPTRASSATGTSSSTGCSSGRPSSGSTRWRPATTPGRTRDADGTWRLVRGADPAKDQSYVLAMLGQDQLARTLFPVGELTKATVRPRGRPPGPAHGGQAGQPGRLLHPLRRGPGRVPGRPGGPPPGPPGRPRQRRRPGRGDGRRAGHGGPAPGHGPRHRRPAPLRDRGRRPGASGHRGSARGGLCRRPRSSTPLAWVDGPPVGWDGVDGVAALAQCSAHGPARAVHRAVPSGDGLAVRFADAAATGGPGPDGRPVRPGPPGPGGRLGGGPMSAGGGRRRATTRWPGPPSCGPSSPTTTSATTCSTTPRCPTPSTTSWSASCGPSRPTIPTWSSPTRRPARWGRRRPPSSPRSSTTCP